MPEGPEAHTMADYLRKILVNKHILDVQILDTAYTRNFENVHIPCRIKNVSAHGKRPIIETNAGYFMTFLCMHGKWLLERSPYAKIIFTIGDCDFSDCITTFIPQFNIYYVDNGDSTKSFVQERDSSRMNSFSYKAPQSFVQFCGNEYGILSYKLDVGPDLISGEFDPDEFIYIARNDFKQSTTLDVFLLSPKSNCSVGNYLKSEILYYARISPRRTLGQCTDEMLTNLLAVSIAFCRESYQKGGLQ